MDTADVFRLRDTLVTALETYHAGPRTIMVQLCLAISGLALQLFQWEDPVQNMIDSFGRNPTTVPALLQFLTILPEELCTNTKIPVTVSVSWRMRALAQADSFISRMTSTRNGRASC